MVEIEKIRELVSLMVEHELTEVELRDGEACVVIKRGTAAGALPQVVVSQAAPPAAAPAQPAAALPAAAADADMTAIRSPMVGTFYAGPDPESPAFVSVGSLVEPDTIVCIIEAMKVFNEIKAEVSGVIEEVLMRNEQPVEYGQPMFRVRPRS